MKNNRIDHAAKNLKWGLANKILQFTLTFFVRTAIIYSLGTDYLGLNSLFASIVTVLNLSELGFGSALLYSMYKPIAENDLVTICALMNYYKKVYRIIGCMVILLGLIIMPLLKYLISGDLPYNINIYGIYLIILSNTAVTYFTFAYKNSLLIAHQKISVSTIIEGIVYIPKTFLQLIMILKYRNYYLLLMIDPIFSIIYNLSIAIYVHKKYPLYIPCGKLSYELQKSIGQKVRGLFIYKIGYIVSGSVDNIVISAFLGLTTLGIFNNYFYVINILFGFLVIYYNSISAGIGNSIAIESSAKNFNDFKKLLFIQGWLVGWISICLLCLFQHFMYLWVGKKLMFQNTTVVCMVIYFYVWKMQDIVNITKEAAGMWNQDKWRPLVSAGVNLTLNLLLIHIWGIIGVVLSTVFASLFVGLPWASRVLFRNYYKRSVKVYYYLLFRYTLITIVIGFVTYRVCALFSDLGIRAFIYKIVVCCLVPNIIYFFINKRNKEFLSIIELLKINYERMKR